MSFNLWARPAPANQPAPVSLYAIKHVLAGRLWSQDGSLRAEPVRLTVGTIDYLRGLRDGSAASETQDDAQALIDLLEANPQGVDLWIGDADDA